MSNRSWYCGKCKKNNSYFEKKKYLWMLDHILVHQYYTETSFFFSVLKLKALQSLLRFLLCYHFDLRSLWIRNFNFAKLMPRTSERATLWFVNFWYNQLLDLDKVCHSQCNQVTGLEQVTKRCHIFILPPATLQREDLRDNGAFLAATSMI